MTKKAPIAGEQLEDLIQKTLKGEILPPRQIDKSIPRALEAICLKALALKVEDRYREVSDIIQDIELYYAGYAPKAEKANLAQEALLLIRRKPFIFATILSSITLIALVASSASYQLQQKNNQLAEQRNEIKKHLGTVEKSKNDLQAIAKLAAKEAHNQAWSSWKSNRLLEAMKLSQTCNRLDPYNPAYSEVNLIQAVFELKPEEAKKAYDLLTPEYQKIYSFLKDFNIDENSRPRELLELCKRIHKTGEWRITIILAYAYYKMTPHSEEKMAIIPEIIEMHYKVKVKNFEWSYKDGKYSIDLSHNGNFKAVHGVNGLNVTRLNISYSTDAQLALLYCPSLEFIDLSHSQLDPAFSQRLNHSKFPNLKTLILDHSRSKDLNLSSLANTNIEEISLRHVDIQDYSFLLQMPKLKSITLHEVKEQFPEKLKTLVKILP